MNIQKKIKEIILSLRLGDKKQQYWRFTNGIPRKKTNEDIPFMQCKIVKSKYMKRVNIKKIKQYEDGNIYIKWLKWGGSYDEGGNGIKIKKWIDLDDQFNWGKQVTYNGEHKNGKKVGRWDVWFREVDYLEKDKENKKIVQQKCLSGCGFYDEKSQKLGNCVEISDGFYQGSYVTLTGQYKNGKKISRWDICYRNSYDKVFKQMQPILYKVHIHIDIKQMCFYHWWRII